MVYHLIYIASYTPSKVLHIFFNVHNGIGIKCNEHNQCIHMGEDRNENAKNLLTWDLIQCVLI